MKILSDNAESVVWTEKICTYAVLKVVVRAVMILHSIQITCGSLTR